MSDPRGTDIYELMQIQVGSLITVTADQIAKLQPYRNILKIEADLYRIVGKCCETRAEAMDALAAAKADDPNRRHALYEAYKDDRRLRSAEFTAEYDALLRGIKAEQQQEKNNVAFGPSTNREIFS